MIFFSSTQGFWQLRLLFFPLLLLMFELNKSPLVTNFL